ncbi:hypothetical protein AB0B15_02985 [Streptomyces sp. NPDC045456]|uniref:hypothetical protein n=1 Tax=Streptomyces sp. NPDC045456 TaxID=3155254 RepID=UPI0033C7248C
MPRVTPELRSQLQAADDFVNMWCETVDQDSHKFGVDLDCAEAKTMARLFEVFAFHNTARQLLEEHGESCSEPEAHFKEDHA